jgi:hypothetical protein
LAKTVDELSVGQRRHLRQNLLREQMQTYIDNKKAELSQKYNVSFDGALYRFDDSNTYKPWQKVDDNGQPIPGDESATRITRDELTRRAPVKPVSDYLDNPVKMFAERSQNHPR